MVLKVPISGRTLAAAPGELVEVAELSVSLPVPVAFVLPPVTTTLASAEVGSAESVTVAVAFTLPR